MTRDKDFKSLVRARMQTHNLTYTAAREELLAQSGRSARQAPTSQLLQDSAATDVETGLATGRTAHSVHSRTGYERARAEHTTIVGRFVRDGRLTHLPTKRTARAHVLLHVVSMFEVGRTYCETEVNELLSTVWDDYAYLRRELVNYGYLHRDSGRYWLPDTAPERTGVLTNEVPDWESLWLPDFLAGNGERVKHCNG